MNASFPNSSVRLDRVFDVVVAGSGLIGLAAVKVLAAKGLDVALVNAGGDLLWETSLALENQVGVPSENNDWSKWIGRWKQSLAVRDGFLDAAYAEAAVAKELEDSKQILTLLYAMPVGVEWSGDFVSGLVLATKEGPRRIRARQWVDASEQGILFQHVVPEADLVRRKPCDHYRSLVLQSENWTELKQWPEVREGMQVFESVRSTERRLRWPVDDQKEWFEDILEVSQACRDQLGVEFVVSHASAVEYPVYEEDASFSPIENLTNLCVLSPALIREKVKSLEERFHLGASVCEKLAACQKLETMVSDLLEAPKFESHLKDEEHQILVAGAGTAGALAALAAAENGGEVLAIDSAIFPGGIGTEGGIPCYCRGLSGGMQTELDELTARISALLMGTEVSGPRWHYLAKRLAILKSFKAQGVLFQGETLLCGVRMAEAGRVTAVCVANAGRLFWIEAKAFVDSTGDGDLCVLAGADSTMGREGDGICLSYSQVGFVLRKSSARLSIHPQNFDAGWVDPSDAEDFSRARLKGLAQHYREKWDSEARPFLLAPLLGLRQSRQIRTEKSVTFSDLVEAAQFEDTIGGTETFADTHAVDFEFESDEAVFYYWVCDGFRHPVACDLPYRMLLPVGLTNVWIACRAAGIEQSATYGIRMQRDIQRLGEAAGTAAAMVATESGESRAVDLSQLQAKLQKTGACVLRDPQVDKLDNQPDKDAGLHQHGMRWWSVYRNPEVYRDQVEDWLNSEDSSRSFFAATVLAMWQNPKAEARLLKALGDREIGPEPGCGKGAFAQEVSVPFWLIAVVFLRRCGTGAVFPALAELAEEAELPFNVRTCIALTVEKLATPETRESVLRILPLLTRNLGELGNLAPSRSLRRMLEGKPQIVLGNATGADTREDQSWQLYLVTARTRFIIHEPLTDVERHHFSDPRSYVRRAFSVLRSD